MAGNFSRTTRQPSGPRANSRASAASTAEARHTTRPAPERTTKRPRPVVVEIRPRLGAQRDQAAISAPPVPAALDPMHNRRLAAARELTRLTPFLVVGSIAVHVHGARSSSASVSLYVPDADQARSVLERVGLKSWLSPDKFALAGVEVSLATPAHLGRSIGSSQIIDNVRVPPLADLISILLVPKSGAEAVRSEADAIALIQFHTLDKRFASRLAPAPVQARFKTIVDSLRSGQDAEPRRGKKDQPA